MALFMDEFIAFVALNVLGFSLCNGLTSMIGVHHGWLWFPNRPGLISGLILGGFGLGSLIFSPIATYLVNPDGIQAVDGRFPNQVSQRVPNMFLILNICFSVMCFVCFILIFPGPDPTKLNDELNDKITNA